MPVHCIDGLITDQELSRWNVPPLGARLALHCEEVRAVFEGSSLARGIALRRLSPVHFDKLFADRSRRKNACTLRRWAGRIQGERARTALARASWEQLRAAAAHEEEDAQISAAVAWALGVGRERPRASVGTARSPLATSAGGSGRPSSSDAVVRRHPQSSREAACGGRVGRFEAAACQGQPGE